MANNKTIATTSKTASTLFEAAELLGIDLTQHQDPFGIEVLEQIFSAGDLYNGTHRFVNQRDEQGRMLLWDNEMLDQNHDEPTERLGADGSPSGWAYAAAGQMTLGAFVEVPMFTYTPSIEVVTKIDHENGSITTRAIAWTHIARLDRNIETVDRIVELSDDGETALVETTRRNVCAPIHVLVEVI